MSNGNGSGTWEDASQTERLVGLVARLNAVLDGLHESVRLLSERLERECEQTRAELRREVGACHVLLVKVEAAVREARDDIERVREDTDPRGFARLDPSQVQPPKHDSGGALVAVARVAEKVPGAWVGAVLKLAVSAGAGGLALRLIQWFTTGH